MNKITRLATALFLLIAGWSQAIAQSIFVQEKALKAADITAGKTIAFKGISITNSDWINWGSTSTSLLLESGIYTVVQGNNADSYILQRKSDGQYIGKSESNITFVSDISQAASFTISQPELNDQDAVGGVTGIHEVNLPDMNGSMNGNMNTDQKTTVLQSSWAYGYQVRFTTDGSYLNIQTGGSGTSKYATGKGSWSIFMVYDAEGYVQPKALTVTLKLQKEDGTVFDTREVNTYVGSSVTIPSFDFTTLSSVKNGTADVTVNENKGVTVTEGMNELTCTYADALKFKTTTIANGTFAENTTWYQLSIHNTGNRSYLKYNPETQIVDPIKSGDLNFYDDTQLWCFTGSAIDGVKVYNKAAGPDVCMTYNTDNVLMTTASEKSIWSLVKTRSTTSGFENAFCLKNSGTYINYNAKNNVITYWGDNDDGSALLAYSFEDYVIDGTAKMEQYISVPEGTVGTPKAGFENAKAAVEAYKANPNATTEQAVYDALNADPIEFSADQCYRIMTTGRNSQHYLTTGATLTGSELNKASASQIWKFTANGDNYNLTSQGVYTKTPAQSTNVATSANASEAQAFIINPKEGTYAQYTLKPALESNSYELHLASGLNIVGWNNAEASNWYLIPATNIDVEVSKAGYATVNYPFAVRIPENMKAYTGTANAESKIFSLSEITNDIIPANTPAILKAEAATYSLEILANDKTPAITEGLNGTLLGTTIDAGINAYILGQGEQGVGFYQMNADDRTLGANKAYLTLPTAASAVRSIIFSDGQTTGIESTVAESTEAEEYYDLQGRRVMNPTKGIYVTKSGKKVVINK